MDRGEQLYREIISALTDRAYLSTCGISRSRVQERSSDIRYLADMILSYSDQNGRISAGNILKAGAVCLEEMSLIPQEGWALHCYMHVRGTISRIWDCRMIPKNSGPAASRHLRSSGLFSHMNANPAGSTRLWT